MTLSFVGKNVEAVICDRDEKLFSMIKSLGIPSPEFDRVFADLYRDVVIPPDRAQRLAHELRRFRDEYEVSLRAELVKRKKISAKAISIRENILAPMVGSDYWYQKLSDIIAVLDDAVVTNSDIQCYGD